jgi:hypothetical protein
MIKSLVAENSFLGRRHFVDGSDARIIMGADEAGLILVLKEQRGEAKPEIRGATSRFRISAARRQSTARVPHQGSSAVRWLFRLLFYILDPGSRRPTPTPSPSSGTKLNPAASIADNNFSTVLSRVSRPVSNRLTVSASAHAASARPAVPQSRSARATRHRIGVT